MPIKIHINWEGPLSIEQVREREENESNTNIGLYQIYGKHPVYGSNVLLYIGLTIDSFYIRNYKKGEILFFQYIENLSFYVGSIKVEQAPGLESIADSEIIAWTESFLTYVHEPAGNSQNLQSIKEFGHEVIVYNWDDYGSLLPEVSTERWSDKYWVDNEIRYREIK